MGEKDMYDEILDRVVPSKYLREYLKRLGPCMGVSYIEDIVYCSPVSIDTKLEILESIKDIVEQDEHNKTLSDGTKQAEDWVKFRHEARLEDYDRQIKTIKKSLELKEGEGVFSVEICGLYEIEDIDNLSFEIITSTFKGALDYIDKWYSTEEQRNVWASITRWIMYKGEYMPTCIYTVHNGVIINSCFSDEYVEDAGLRTHIDDREIHTYVPYKPGDLLEVKGGPFVPDQRIVIIDIGDNWDCCCVQGMYLDEDDGEIRIRAVKHGMIRYYMKSFMEVSPLYTADFFVGPLKPEEAILKKVSDFLGGDEKKGRKMLLDNMFGWTEEEMSEWIENYRG
ncbi:hypothetical protein [Eubacterium xylanophilum]|uniref:hypothetical protein n=1 Tax=Eubacterium xylanophilum TaxID=39497 RepID=UPI001A994AD3|nr:hypothetical protein [Eubacterium xylanophilum]